MSDEEIYNPGDIVTVSGTEFVILDIIKLPKEDEPRYIAMTVKSQFNSIFDDESNDYAKSDLRNRVEEWIEEADLDKAMLAPRFLNLMALDGYRGNGYISALAAPLTLDERRKYAGVIPGQDGDEWLATCWGDPEGADGFLGIGVTEDGRVMGYDTETPLGCRPAVLFDPKYLRDEGKKEIDLTKVPTAKLFAELGCRLQEGLLVDKKEG